MLVGLYEEPEKPGNVIDFIKKSLGAPSDTDVEQLMAENEELKRQKNDLEKKIEILESELQNERAKQSWVIWVINWQWPIIADVRLKPSITNLKRLKVFK
mgnify:CR=1 FL=1